MSTFIHPPRAQRLPRSVTPCLARCLSLGLLLAGCSGQIDERPQTRRPPAGGDRDLAPSPAAPPATPDTPSPPDTPAAPPATAVGDVDGILDCPTVDYPGATSATVTLSSSYQRMCAACHGGSGEGAGLYPELPGRLSRQEFLAKVRAGAENMPAVSAALVPDDTVLRDYDALAARRAGGAPTLHPSQRWSAAEVEAKRARGMELWRTPDREGAACANCHAADAVDLAVIGYPDATILRRATMHLPIEQAAELVDFIHAQRRAFGVRRPCDPEWRVFQPGGRVLPGRTAAEQDAALWAELQRRGILVATASIDTVAQADQAWQQLAQLNLRRFPIGVPLPRWTEDRFHGKERASINDWIPAVPRLPRGPAWYARVDAYLADPSDARLTALLDEVPRLTSDGGFAERPGVTHHLAGVMLSKYESVQVAAHYFRKALRGEPGWFESADQPIALPIRGTVEGVPANPFVAIGGHYQENHCINHPDCGPAQYQALPEIARVEFEPHIGMDRNPSAGFPLEMRKALTHSWWTLAMVFDPSFARGRETSMHYWLDFADNGVTNFEHQAVHRPFFAAVIMAKRAAALDGPAGGVKHVPGVPGVLNGSIVFGFEHVLEFSRPTAQQVRLITNVQRMTLLRMRRALQQGAPVARRHFWLEHQQETIGQLTMWRHLLRQAIDERRVADLAPVRATLPLVEEVIGLVRAAPERTAR